MFHHRKRLFSFSLEKYITVDELEYDKLGNGESLIVSIDRKFTFQPEPSGKLNANPNLNPKRDFLLNGPLSWKA